MPPVIPLDPPASRRSPTAALTFDVGMMETMVFPGDADTPQAELGVGRMEEGIKVIGMRTEWVMEGTTGILIALDDTAIDDLIAILQKLRRSDGPVEREA